MLRKLQKRERKILTMYYGFEYDMQATLEDIGARLNITRERVRQLRDLALKDLRKAAGKRALEEYLV
jgi:RNA polymerase primary sigma factor